ncbi:hypothetical protein JW906_01550 [bacterium]|nr:hypothetical protein [bacterium]
MIRANRLAMIVFTALLLAQGADLKAIPAFARRYRISCSTCHAPFPKLKEYGDEFAGNGMILKEEEKERDYVVAGDDLLWLNRTFQMGVRFDAYALADPDAPVDKDLQIPWGLKFLSGGTLYKNIGYYFYFYMSERGEVAGIEDAYVHFDNLFGTGLDIMAGQFQTSDPLMKRELRLTFEDYMIYKARPGLSKTNLTYDRGLMFVYGVEKTGTDLVAMVVNGNGKGMADEETQKFDMDSEKNFGLRLSQSIASFASVGGFYYKGREILTDAQVENSIRYWGPDFSFQAGPLEATVQYLEREDGNPSFAAEQTVQTTGIVAEVIFSPALDRSRWFLTGLYNRIESDLEELNYETATINGTYLVARNLRLTAEYTRDLENEANRFVLGMVTGF